MQTAPQHGTSAELGAKLRAAENVTAELMADILGIGRRRVLVQALGEHARQLDQLVDAGAWTDAALMLLELELPFWHLRRIAYDAGEWFCALSRQRELPDWMDQSIEGRHPDLALAILTVYVEAQQRSAPRANTSVPASPRGLESGDIPLCCDHFS